MSQTIRLFKPLLLIAALYLTACSGGGTAYSTGSSVPAAGNTSSGSASGATTAFTISGVVSGGSAATLNLTGLASASTGTDSSGNYSFAALGAGSYTVTPGLTGFQFSPVSRAASITTASLTDVVFTANANTATTYTLSGSVSGSVMAGVEITLNGTNIGSTLTDLSGNYSFTGLSSGTYTVSASLDGYAFTAPLIVSVSNTDSTGDDFTSTAQSSATLAFTPVATLPQAVVGAAYSQTVISTTTGGTAPYTYRASTLDSGTPPLGMIVNPNGKLTGTPSIVGAYSFNVCAVDSAGTLSTCEPTSIAVVAATAPDPTPSPTPPVPATVSLAASPATINSGTTSSLAWTSKNATSCTASGGWSGSKGSSGTSSVSPTSTTTYTISCAGTGGAGKTSVVVTVKPVTPTVPAPSVKLTPTVATVTSGTGSTLTWASKNAAGCTASGGWTGSKALSGSTRVTPTGTTSYTITCTSAGGSASAASKITVTTAASSTPAPTIALAASPSTITAGAASVLTWSSTDADSCTAGGSWSGAKGDTGTSSVSPTSTATYSLTCSGAGGTAKASAKITVNAVATASTPPASGNSWVYHNGTFDWPGDYSFPSLIPNYKDTSGSPLSGAYDIKVVSPAWGGWLPYAQNWSFNSGPYTKLTFSLKPTASGQAWQVYFVKVGDIPVGITLNVENYGPKPVAGQWGTYTVPLKDLGVQGTTIYKFAIQDQSGRGNNTWYIDNVGFIP